MDKVAVLIGPTAVGKTAISLQVAEMLDAEIISGDSMQVYRGMDIGTAKIRPAEMRGPRGKTIPHHLIDSLQPDQPFSAADFQLAARRLIREISSRGRLPLLVGGTGLYVNAALDDYRFAAAPVDADYRAKKLAEAAAHGVDWLHRQLQQVDPQSAAWIHPHDQRRIIRALEVFAQSGRTISQQTYPDRRPLYQTAWAGLKADRHLIYQRIECRVDQMMTAGLSGEVERLIRQGYPPSLVAMQGLGYRQMAHYLTGLSTREEAVRLLKRDTRHFAKRQLTWFRRDQRIRWFELAAEEDKSAVAGEIAAYFGRSLGITVEY